MISFQFNKIVITVLATVTLLNSTSIYPRSLFNITTLPTTARMHAGETTFFVYTVSNPAGSGVTVTPSSILISSTSTLNKTVPQVQTTVTANNCNTAMAPGDNCTVSVQATAPSTPGNYKLSLQVDTADGSGGSQGRNNPFSLIEPSTAGCTGPSGACKIFATDSSFNGKLEPDGNGTNDAEIQSVCGISNADNTRLTFANCICNVLGGKRTSGIWRAVMSNGTINATTNIRYLSTEVVVQEQTPSTVVATAGNLFQNYNHPNQIVAGAGVNGGEPYAGTNAIGTTSGLECASWTNSGALQGSSGDVTALTGNWIFSAAPNCDTFHSIYCIESP